MIIEGLLTLNPKPVKVGPLRELRVGGLGLHPIPWHVVHKLRDKHMGFTVKGLKSRVYGRYFPKQFMDMGSLLGTIFETIPSYKKDLYIQVKGPLRLVLTVDHTRGISEFANRFCRA